MYEINFSKKYEKIAKKFFKKHQNLKQKYTKTILLLQKDPHHPSLRLHKLQGSLSEYYSISIDLEYRIIIDFIIVDNVIYLIDIGSHDEVY
ncbi:type II toxin-antitoxin system mRNA interferase toxin, RelE/StbE family [Sulfurimonas sp. SAG-AH-194-L11]|nr:type II toxin-antitoxin system mRNA interferase toxin, RelE/StbE family [Sulfurimonas sp. SAG-AH-194-L11]MDF1877544.1 type II toxin-antitoxin system mRNA interferase toxin, RelE/StbE family [Sulfurimonas sp. SAG-AH-194-L11]